MIDLGILLLSVNCIVIVNISDINDNLLVFIKIVYFVIVDENVVNDINVILVLVIDRDSGFNGIVRYFLGIN